jgi:hypothetical protein
VFLGSEMSTHKWKGYCWREKFQKDLAQKVIEYGKRLDWTDYTDENAKPAYMRNMGYIPCDCKTCYF